jgi:hypothetical protein
LLAITIFLLYIRKRKTVNSSQLTFPKAGCTPPCEF